MKNVAVALYAEGPTDQLFLPEVIHRTVKQNLNRSGQQSIDVKPVDPISFSKTGMKQDECILQAARRAANYNILIVHADADHRTEEKALKERFNPGYLLVQQAQEHVCRCVLPIVPVRMTEAWMLADPEALRAALGTSKNAQELGLPLKAKLVENDSDPKQTLKMIVGKANTHRSRQRHLEVTTLYTLLGRTIDLSRLSNVPAYQRFVHALVNAFRTINL
ncbi:MAG TPA: DUF4276 family protein, partial [Ktedonobacteraceae bacterium]|nr:DUF4276 family protein [Ktedonobacteraceae bacterium]